MSNGSAILYVATGAFTFDFLIMEKLQSSDHVSINFV